MKWLTVIKKLSENSFFPLSKTVWNQKKYPFSFIILLLILKWITLSKEEFWRKFWTIHISYMLNNKINLSLLFTTTSFDSLLIFAQMIFFQTPFVPLLSKSGLSLLWPFLHFVKILIMSFTNTFIRNHLHHTRMIDNTAM